MRKEDRVRLRHMLDAAEEAMRFAQGGERQALDLDRKLTLALVKDIEIIGEAAYQISDQTRSRLSDIPWDDIIGMRHRLVHAYFDLQSGYSMEDGSRGLAAAGREAARCYGDE